MSVTELIPDPSPQRTERPRPSRRAVAIGFILALLIVVGGCAAALSFASIRGLAIQCGIAAELAWLLPIVIDTGIVAGTIVWLSRRLFPNVDARRLAAGYTTTLLGLSVAANVTNHVLAVEHLDPNLWVIIPVSAIAPATVFVVVHLAVTALRPAADMSLDAAASAAGGSRVSTVVSTVRSATARLRRRAVVAEDRPHRERDTDADAVTDTGVDTDTDMGTDTGAAGNQVSTRPYPDTDADGYSAAIRALAVQTGLTLEPAPPGETAPQRVARVNRNRKRVTRAADRRNGDRDPQPVLAGG